MLSPTLSAYRFLNSPQSGFKEPLPSADLTRPVRRMSFLNR